jgi:predicted RNase H-like nuclease (RuvC/YqgF family)
MGNFFSKKDTTNQQIEEILTLLDKNKDGAISKEEFNQWKNTELQNIINNTMNSTNEITRLTKINNELQKELDEKNKLIDNLINNNTSVKNTDLIKHLSRQRIDGYIDNILKENNIAYLPDVIERQFYRNVFKLLLELVGSVSCELVGHKVDINVAPKD